MGLARFPRDAFGDRADRMNRSGRGHTAMAERFTVTVQKVSGLLRFRRGAGTAEKGKGVKENEGCKMA